MDKEEFLSLIEELNGFCNCEDILFLRQLAEVWEHADDICSPLLERNRTAQEQEIYEENLSKLLEYGILSQQEMVNLIEKGSLILYYYDPEKDYEKERVSSEQAKDLLENGGIITANCICCGQQIDLIDHIA